MSLIINPSAVQLLCCIAGGRKDWMFDCVPHYTPKRIQSTAHLHPHFWDDSHLSVSNTTMLYRQVLSQSNWLSASYTANTTKINTRNKILKVLLFLILSPDTMHWWKRPTQPCSMHPRLNPTDHDQSFCSYREAKICPSWDDDKMWRKKKASGKLSRNHRVRQQWHLCLEPLTTQWSQLISGGSVKQRRESC